MPAPRLHEPPITDTDLIIFGARKCDCCGRWLPRSSEYFGHDCGVEDCLNTTCRKCRRERDRGRYAGDAA